MFPSSKTLYAMEDRVMKMRGLYFMSFCCYVGSLACLAADGHSDDHAHDEHEDPCRNFLLYTSLLSTLYWGVSSANTIYGNGKPSSMIMMAGPIHQFSFWLLLAYYRGDVYGKEPAGVMNAVHTTLVAFFNLDLLIKTWLLAIKPDEYLEYVNDGNKPPLESIVS
ncbi:MAG: hypothetical protein CL678_01915 [Bdellovibrionaceae bacterium]|nr:hypothetical protein [Pseudobdellovibrionaceae bacterium]|tara:strand:+ start:136 stop:630 length:495 start_codon:yes stop_codon:yes gene_type:complete